jgi:hypothetical protein
MEKLKESIQKICIILLMSVYNFGNNLILASYVSASDKTCKIPFVLRAFHTGNLQMVYIYPSVHMSQGLFFHESYLCLLPSYDIYQLLKLINNERDEGETRRTNHLGQQSSYFELLSQHLSGH